MTPGERPSWDDVWFSVAQTVAQRSRCERAQVGAVIVTDANRPVAVGYNGPPSRMQTARGGCSNWCGRAQADATAITQMYGLSCPTVHAEINALMFADRSAYEGGSIYVTGSICGDCAKAVANSGLRAVNVIVNWQRDKHREPGKVVDFLRQCSLRVNVRSEGAA